MRKKLNPLLFIAILNNNHGSSIHFAINKQVLKI